MVKIRLDHIGIAVNDLEEGQHFWKLLGMIPELEDELVEDQGVVTRFCLLYTSPSPRDPH